ncbi:hypothetical protein CRENPOLYSF1_170064 [Crenothrix polyspora]|uniref:Uncharacterized protein n=1 Tax=Crenothrix polyspora TaxID=360316 RepID=A0A1R4H434_9GAMM|nr:hypothetical protein CRENPOLYSF1_170064 [Crenothrix polyspora]
MAILQAFAGPQIVHEQLAQAKIPHHILVDPAFQDMSPGEFIADGAFILCQGRLLQVDVVHNRTPKSVFG